MVTPRQHATVRHCRDTHKLTSRWHFHVPADRWYIWKHICDNECMNGSYPIQFPNSHARLQSGIFHPALNGQSSTTHQQHLHVQGCRQMMDYELGKTLVHAYNIFIYLFAILPVLWTLSDRHFRTKITSLNHRTRCMMSNRTKIRN